MYSGITVSPNMTLLIAPCGMNCSICSAYLRKRNTCPGCRGADIDKPVTRIICKIKTCKNLQENSAEFCFDCEEFPCNNLKHLDKRYRMKYHMSMIENLGNIRDFGIKRFLENEEERWTCSECGGTICVHKGCCFKCGKKK